MDHQPPPLRSRPLALRWLVVVLLLLAGGTGLVPVVEADDGTRAQAATVVVAEHRRTARRAIGPRPTPTPGRRQRRRASLLATLAARLRPALVDARRGPPRAPCVVALS